ncbi:hypothetical protein ZHAS_00012794 [Anopheles sinensis]|uniref:Uncharacterized protein n=1 Tax=Anopheles sinensis TaxID=74873 RepID=A0A084W3U0_ANOSI|nr:hypothetical protein ZHAS_00012794 [Anopheles sinensis]
MRKHLHGALFVRNQPSLEYPSLASEARWKLHNVRAAGERVPGKELPAWPHRTTESVAGASVERFRSRLDSKPRRPLTLESPGYGDGGMTSASSVRPVWSHGTRRTSSQREANESENETIASHVTEACERRKQKESETNSLTGDVTEGKETVNYGKGP